MSTGFTTVTASHLQDATGSPIQNATIYFSPVDNSGESLSFRTGGTQGQTISQAVSATVTNGAFSLVVADTTLTMPVNIGYKVTVIDNVTGDCLLGSGYTCVQPYGATWSFDSYQPNLAPQVAVQTGAQGFSAYDLAVQGGYTGTQSQWLGSLTNGPTLSATVALRDAAAPAVRNIFDPASAKAGVLINYQTGIAVPYTGESYVSTGYMAVTPGGDYVANANTDFSGGDPGLGWSFYDQSKVYLSGLPGVAAGVHVTAPQGAYYARVGFGSSAASSLLPSTIARFMVCPGQTVPLTYVPFLTGTAITTQSNAVNTSVSSLFAPTANLFNSATTVTGALRTDTGLPDSTSSYFTSAYIPVSGISKLVANHGDTAQTPYGWVFYDANQTPLSTGNVVFPYTSGTAVTVPGDAAFVRVTGDKSYLSTYMLNPSSTVNVNFTFPLGAYDPSLDAYVSSFLSVLSPQTNLFNGAGTVPGALHGTDGVVDNVSGWWTSQFIPVYGLTQIVANQSELNTGSPYGWQFYDRSKHPIASGAMQFPYTKGTAINVPTGAFYVRVTGQSSYLATYMLNPGGSLFAGLNNTLGAFPTITPSRWGGKVYGAVGDSITNVGYYQVKVAANLGMTLGLNNGCGGRGMTQLFTDSCFTNVLTANAVQNVDLLTIFLGVNDHLNSVPLGSLSDTNFAQGFYGAVDYAINTILSWKPTLRLVFITPMNHIDNSTFPAVNAQGLHVKDYADAINTKCALYSVPTIDLNRICGLNALNIPVYCPGDGLHPDGPGHDAITIPNITAGLARL